MSDNQKNRKDDIWNDMVTDIITMPKFAPKDGLKKNETTIKLMAEKLENKTGLQWSHSKTRNRMMRLVKQGRMKVRTEGNLLVFTKVK